MARFGNMKYAVTFAILATACFYKAWQVASAWKWLFGWSGVALAGVAAAYACNQPGFLMKKAVGTLSLPSLALFFPVHLVNFLLLHLVRRNQRENAFDEIVPGVFVGRQLLPSEAVKVRQAGIQAVLDLTAEFQEVSFLRAARAYRCIPLLDNTAPDPGQLKAGVQWIAAQIRQGPVYVHCAAGHGRSAVFVAAFLVFARLARDAESACALLKAKRPRVHLKSWQFESLKSFSYSNFEETFSGGSQ